MDSTVTIAEKIVGEVLILSLKGRLDAISSVDVEKRLFDYIDEGHFLVILNFSEVDYLSSVGMRLLLRTAKKLKMLKGKLVVCSVSGHVMDVLKMSGFDHVIDFAKNEEEALVKFR